MEKRQTSQQNMRNVRAIALDILLQVMEEGKYCDRTLHRTLNREDTLSKQQRAFLTRLVEGTVEQAIRLDYIINCFSKTKVVKMKPVIRETLRMAVYQLFYMDQVPDSAACNEAVKLVRKRGLKGLSGFVNGVLRSVIRGKDQIKYPDAKDFISYASIKYSMPGWIIEYFLEEYSEAETEQILHGFMQKESGVTVRCNLNLQNPSGNPDLAVPEIIESLERQQVKVQPGNGFRMLFIYPALSAWILWRRLREEDCRCRMKVRCLLVLFPGSNRDKRYWTFVQHRAANLCTQRIYWQVPV